MESRSGGALLTVMVMDGQGGGIGAAVIKGLRAAAGHELEILALGTNSTATARMMKAGANRGATGENAILRTSLKADVIVGPLAVLMPNAMMGEVTPRMAEAVCSCGAAKVLIPLTQEKVTLVGFHGEPLPHLVDQVVQRIKEFVNHV
ncbi:MAG: DUF3842 family protein [Deltaproteobacteria bacterium]|nr:DUF3842 family protein [Deltaproteobacteria bacterium]